MNINLYCNNQNQPYRFTPELGISYLNIAVNDAPYRTGNLRGNIILQQNGPKIKRIVYNDTNAYYLNYLEDGIGRNKAHKGFISIDTTNDIFNETVSFLLTGVETYTTMPSIVYRTDRARNYERQLLKNSGISTNKRLTASDRATLSRMYIRQNNIAKSQTYYTRNNQTANQPQITSVINNKLFYGWGQLRGK